MLRQDCFSNKSAVLLPLRHSSFARRSWIIGTERPWLHRGRCALIRSEKDRTSPVAKLAAFSQKTSPARLRARLQYRDFCTRPLRPRSGEFLDMYRSLDKPEK